MVGTLNPPLGRAPHGNPFALSDHVKFPPISGLRKQDRRMFPASLFAEKDCRIGAVLEHLEIGRGPVAHQFFDASIRVVLIVIGGEFGCLCVDITVRMGIAA